MEGAESEPTRIMVAVNESSIKGYPHASISSRRAFDWTLQKIIRSNTSGFKLLFLHVQVPDEDGIAMLEHPYDYPHKAVRETLHYQIFKARDYFAPKID